jgi:hypothetical protein
MSPGAAAHAGGRIPAPAHPPPRRQGGAAGRPRGGSRGDSGGRRPLAVLVRAAIAAAALALAVVPLLRQRALGARQEAMAAWLGRYGVLVPAALRYEPDGGRVELRAARASLGAELDPSRQLPLEARERLPADAVSRMAETAHLAGLALAQRPAAWDAAMVLGAATYLSWSQGRDGRLFTAAPAWERPLETAIALAPGHDEAARLLATAYLEIWPALSPAKRRRERELLAVVFRDPQVFARLVSPWLAVAPSREEAFAVVPPMPELWSKLQQIYAEQADWQGYCATRERWDQVLHAWLARRLAEAEQLRVAGEAREQFLAVATESRTGSRYLDLLTRALEDCPPGFVDRRTAARLGKHLAWSLERCQLDRCPLSPRAMRRLAGFCRDVDPRIDAMAALVTGDFPRAEILERTYATALSDDWAAYRLLKARVLAARGLRGPEAEAALVQVPSSWSRRPSFWLAQAAAARAAENAAAETAAARELARLAARQWPPDAWHFHGGLPRLELLAAAGAGGFELAIDAAPPRGAAVEVRLDDAILGTFPVSTDTPLVLGAPLAPGLHLLELEAVAGGAVLPGTVRLSSTGGGSGSGPRGEAR